MAFIFNLPRIDENTPKETLISYLKQMNEQLTYAMNLLDDRTVALSSAIGVDEDTIESGSALIKKINMSSQEMSINADKINLNGYTDINGHFIVSQDGKVSVDGDFTSSGGEFKVDTSQDGEDYLKLNNTYGWSRLDNALLHITSNDNRIDDRVCCEIGSVDVDKLPNPSMTSIAHGVMVYQQEGELVGTICVYDGSPYAEIVPLLKCDSGIQSYAEIKSSGNISTSGTLTVGTTSSNKNATINGEMHSKTIHATDGNIYIDNKDGALIIGKPKTKLSTTGSRILFRDCEDGEDGTLRGLLDVSYQTSSSLYRTQLGCYSANNYMNIGSADYTQSINIGSKGNVNVVGQLIVGNATTKKNAIINGNLYLNGSSNGTQNITTTASNLSSPTFSASTVGQIYLLTLNNATGSATYLVHCGSGDGIGVNLLGGKFTGNAITVTASGYKVNVKCASGTISTTYRWTRIV